MRLSGPTNYIGIRQEKYPWFSDTAGNGERETLNECMWRTLSPGVSENKEWQEEEVQMKPQGLHVRLRC